ncbi:MAG: hypothetical protein SGI77_05805 [Pirellulaceae bacterium]|nr:hypothetical protein [Pirellulaceae bacterium]
MSRIANPLPTRPVAGAKDIKHSLYGRLGINVVAAAAHPLLLIQAKPLAGYKNVPTSGCD